MKMHFSIDSSWTGININVAQFIFNPIRHNSWSSVLILRQSA